MRKALLFLFLLCVLPSQVVYAQDGTELVISSPQTGQVVQGLEVVTGTVDILGFSTYDLAFAYAQDDTNTWFLLESSTLPVFEGNLGTWDTMLLTDGDYDLRLRVFLLDGSVQEATVTGLRVRNYTPAPTEIPSATPTEFAQLIVPTARYLAPETPTATASFPTPTMLPANPIALERKDILSAIGRGAFMAGLGILAFALFLRLRKN